MGGEYPIGGDGFDNDIDDDDDDCCDEVKIESSRMYNHPMMKPAKPNKYGTHHVVTNAGMFGFVLHNCIEKGLLYCNTPKLEWYVSRNGPSVAPAIMDDIEKSIDRFGLSVIVLIILLCQDSSSGDCCWGDDASSDVLLRRDCNSDGRRIGSTFTVGRKHERE